MTLNSKILYGESVVNMRFSCPIKKHSDSRSCTDNTPAALVLNNRGQETSSGGEMEQRTEEMMSQAGVVGSDGPIIQFMSF